MSEDCGNVVLGNAQDGDQIQSHIEVMGMGIRVYK